MSERKRQSERANRPERAERPADQRGGRPEHGAQRPPRPNRRARPPALDVDALLAHASDPSADLLAEAEEEARLQAERTGQLAAAQPASKATGADLTDIATLRRILQRHGLRPNKSFGQNFLVSRAVLESIIAAAELREDDTVLEVGAGTGVLTRELAERTRRVVAVELDRAILPVLRETASRLPNVEILARDLLQVDPTDVFGQEPYKLVANLPYYITALTLRHFLEAANPPRLLVVMVQWEVGERLAAQPGDLSLLGLSVQFFGTPRIIARVPAQAFYPAPQVDSAIVRVDLLASPPLDGMARALFFRLAHAGFAEKRKQLHNSLARNLLLPQQTIARWLAAAAIDPMRRAETLSVDDWRRLTRAAEPDLCPRDPDNA